jgi:hypothetical protein
VSLKLTPGELKKLERNLNGTSGNCKKAHKNAKEASVDEVHQTTSELMSEYVRHVEKKLGRNLTPNEARAITPEALAYAKAMRVWVFKAKAERKTK